MNVFCFFILYAMTIRAQWIQLNVSTEQDEYLKAIAAVVLFFQQSPSYSSSNLYPAALFVVNESYNQKFRVVLSVQNGRTIELHEIIIVTGKTTSGRYEITESTRYDDEAEMKIANKYYIRVQNEIERCVRGKRLKYIRKIVIQKEFFLVYFNIREDAKIRGVVVNVDMGDQLRLSGVFII